MATQTKDPVCGMNVDAKKTQHKTDYHGKNYAFCCKECLTKFKENPHQYESKHQ